MKTQLWSFQNFIKVFSNTYVGKADCGDVESSQQTPKYVQNLMKLKFHFSCEIPKK